MDNPLLKFCRQKMPFNTAHYPTIELILTLTTLRLGSSPYYGQKKEIYACGGSNENYETLKSCEKYSVESD